MTDPIPCEALATKAELEELRQQINELFGRLEEDETQVKDVLRDGNLTGTQFIGAFMPDLEVTQETVKASTNLGSKIRDNIYLKDRKFYKQKGGALHTKQTKTVEKLNKLIKKNTIKSTAAYRTATRNVGAIGTVATIALQALNTGITLVQILGFNQAVVDNLGNQWRNDQNDFNITFPVIKRNREIAEENREIIDEEVADLRVFIDNQTIQMTENNRIINNQDLELKNRLNIIETIKDNTTQLVLQLAENQAEYEALADEFYRYRGEAQEEIQDLQDFDFSIFTQLTSTQTQVADLSRELETTKLELLKTQENIVSRQEFNLFKEQVLLETKTLLNDVDLENLPNQEVEEKIEEARVRLTTIYDYSLSSGSNSGGGGGFPQSAKDSLKTTQNKQIEALAKQTNTDPETLEGYPIEDYQVGRFDSPFSAIIDSLIPQLTPPNTDNNDAEISDVKVDEIKEELKNEVNASMAASFAGLGITAATFNQLLNNTSQQNLTNAAQTAVCNTTSPNGCMTQNIRNPIQQGQGAIRNLITNTLQGLDLVQGQAIFNIVSNTNEFVKKAWQTTRMDKVLNLLNTILALHNALMLSRNLGQTLGDVATQALQFFKIKDSEDNAIDVNQVIGNTVEKWITNIIGAEKYTTIQQTWTNLNRIMVSAQGVILAVRGIKEAVLEGLEVVGGWTAKIGNNMMIQGLLEERSFPWMSERPNFRNPFRGFLQKIETTEEVAGQLNNLVSSGIEAQENFNELFKQSEELVTASQELQASLDKFDTDKETDEQTEVTDSLSPAITNQDLIKKEE